MHLRSGDCSNYLGILLKKLPLYIIRVLYCTLYLRNISFVTILSRLFLALVNTIQAGSLSPEYR